MCKLIRVTTADISLYSLLKGQLKFLNREFEVIGVAADTGYLEKVGEREGIRVINVPMHREISLLSDIACLFKLIRVFFREKPFIVHSNTPKGSLLSMIAAKVVGVPNRLYLVTGLRYQGETGFKRYLMMIMERICCSCATRVIPEGEGVKKTLINDYITHKSLKVIHNGNINGIDTSYFSRESCPYSEPLVRADLGINEDDFVFVFVGRIVRDKGLNELAEAMQSLAVRYPQVKLILVGSFESNLDPLMPGNEDFLKHSASVLYVGERLDVRRYLVAADALVFPSYREGFPNVVLEAGAMNLPAIVTNINGSNEIILDGVNGVIIPPRNKDALLEKMICFIENPDYVHNMSLNARQMITSRYEQKDVWDALMKMYKGL